MLRPTYRLLHPSPTIPKLFQVTTQQLGGRDPWVDPPPKEKNLKEWGDLKIKNLKSAKAKADPILCYRSLLRGASYIPDPYARKLVLAQIKKSSSWRRASERFTSQRLKKAIKHARCLERASRGSKDDLYRVLAFAYGRAGKRRRQLVDKLLEPDKTAFQDTKSFQPSPADKKVIEHLRTVTTLPNTPEGLPILQVMQSNKFTSFLTSQRQRPAIESSPSDRGKLRKTTPSVPLENIWGRPMPKKRTANVVAEWWGGTLDKINPPVSIHEWNHLKALSTGATRVPNLIPRRSHGSRSFKEIDVGNIQKHEEVLAAFRDSRYTGTFKFDPKDGLTVTKSAEESTEENENVRDIAPENYQRTMRRLYATIWNLTPTMSKDATGKWQISWGGSRSSFHSGEIAQGTEEIQELFEVGDNLQQILEEKAAVARLKAAAPRLENLQRLKPLNRPRRTPEEAAELKKGMNGAIKAKDWRDVLRSKQLGTWKPTRDTRGRTR